jgi:hypothetical protein
MLRWESVAPFGNPVVPLVNWMLIGWPRVDLGGGAAGSRARRVSGYARELEPARPRPAERDQRR